MTTPEVHNFVLKRDGECVVTKLARERGLPHTCHGKWGLEDPHRSNDLSKLTIDHVNLITGGVRGKRAVCPVHKTDDEHVSVAMCATANVNGPDRGSGLTWTDVRDYERAYLRALYPEVFEIIDSWLP